MTTDLSRLGDLATEQANSHTAQMDTLSAPDLVRALHAENHTVALAVEQTLDQIAAAVEQITARLRAGGRMLYIGAGTSGRLGVLDASECPPTFGVDTDLIQGIIAGGDTALRSSIEGAEDDPAAGAAALIDRDVSAGDVVVGIAASGRTPFVIGALRLARERSAYTIAVVNSLPSPMADLADTVIAPITGAEPLTGSTRLKAGTAQKMVLNLLSTAVMVRLGKTYGNLMVDVRPTNQKLRERAIGIVAQVTQQPREQCIDALCRANWRVKPAIVLLTRKTTPQEAEEMLAKADGFIRKVLNSTTTIG